MPTGQKRSSFPLPFSTQSFKLNLLHKSTPSKNGIQTTCANLVSVLPGPKVSKSG